MPIGYSGIMPFGPTYTAEPSSWCPNLSTWSESEPALDKVRRFVNNCVSNHPKCRSARYLPRRLLDVSPEDAVLLVDRAAVGADNQDGRYVALSHCWGKRQLLRTTKSAVESHARGIPLHLCRYPFRTPSGLQRAWASDISGSTRSASSRTTRPTGKNRRRRWPTSTGART